MNVRPARNEDSAQLALLRAALWPDGTVDEHARDLEQIFGGEWSRTYPYVVLVAEEAGIIGFAEVTLRSRADGCDPTRPVGYLEGWYVDASRRRQGVGAALLAAAEEWAKAQGCTEMASDTWLDNEISQRAHEALGFEVVDRVVTFRKPLTVSS
ncbi:MAG TPA: GNAT family N-acetyltransferase [Thermoanaerobaculia bacterium]|nr:GNAT family N-acetyltransferase [Thermoanaerobaculia bacterium]